jgi:uncharacterized protein (DUF2252 family)
MIASPYGFLRGAAVVMAEDFARLPATGITPIVCGNAHVGNIGFSGSPERELVLDLNDFDEVHPVAGSGPAPSHDLLRGLVPQSALGAVGPTAALALRR